MSWRGPRVVWDTRPRGSCSLVACRHYDWLSCVMGLRQGKLISTHIHTYTHTRTKRWVWWRKSTCGGTTFGSEKATNAGRSRPVKERSRAELESAHTYICGKGIRGAIYVAFGGSWQCRRGLVSSISKVECQQYKYLVTKTGKQSTLLQSITLSLLLFHALSAKYDRKTLRPVYFPSAPSECHGYAPYRTPEQ